MKKILVTLSVAAMVLTGACQQATQKTSTTETVFKAVNMDARLGAVLVYADWCGSCKVLDPKVETVKASHDFEDTFFLKLDYTDKDIEAFYAAAKAAGINDPVNTYLGGKVKTGQLLLIDMDDQTVVDVIKMDMSPEDIAAKIKSAESEA